MAPTLRSILLLSCTLLSSVLSQTPPPPPTIDPNFFSSLPAKDKLEYVDCYEGLKCARFNVPAEVEPRQYGYGERRQRKVALAIAKLPALDQENKKGVIHISLGGFSSSNTVFLIRFGRGFQVLFPQYDLLAIDNRGTGYSTPRLECFKSQEERVAWTRSAPPILGSSDRALSLNYDRAKEFGRRCKDNAGDIARYLGTYAVAQDHYTVMKAEGRSKLSFWGFSTGSHTGQTIASLYPDAVDKFVLDGIMRSDVQYTVGDAQPDTIVDAEKALRGFFYTCVTAGPTSCSFAGTSKTVEALKARYDAIDAKLRRRSVPVPDFPAFDYSAFHNYVLFVLQDAVNFANFAQALKELEAETAGEGLKLASQILSTPPEPLPPQSPSPDFVSALPGIYCLDRDEYRLRRLSDFVPFLKRMLAASPATGGISAGATLTCAGWKIRPVNEYPGRFTTKKIAGQIVFVGNTADAITPLASARYVAGKFFPGSPVVVNNAIAHTSLVGSGQSFALYGVVQAFFSNDTLPADGFVTQPDFLPFGVALPANF